MFRETIQWENLQFKNDNIISKESFNNVYVDIEALVKFLRGEGEEKNNLANCLKKYREIKDSLFSKNNQLVATLKDVKFLDDVYGDAVDSYLAILILDEQGIINAEGLELTEPQDLENVPRFDPPIIEPQIEIATEPKNQDNEETQQQINPVIEDLQKQARNNVKKLVIHIIPNILSEHSSLREPFLQELAQKDLGIYVRLCAEQNIQTGNFLEEKLEQFAADSRSPNTVYVSLQELVHFIRETRGIDNLQSGFEFYCLIKNDFFKLGINLIVKADSIDALMQFFKNCTSQTQVNLATLIIQVQKGISVSSVDHEINIKKLALFDKLQEELLKLGIDILDEKDKDNIKILKGKETFVSECTSKLFIGGFYNYARENLDNPLSALKVSVTGFFRLDKERTLDLIRGILNNPEYVFLKTEIATNVVSNSNNNTAINIPMPPRTSIPPPPKLPQSEQRKRANTTTTRGFGDISNVQLKKVELPVDDKKLETDKEAKGDVANIAKLAMEQGKKLRSSVLLPETIVDDSIKIEDNTATALSIEEKIKRNKQQTGSTPVGENSSNLWRTNLRRTGSTLISPEVSNQTNTNNPPPPNMPSMGNNNNNN